MRILLSSLLTAIVVLNNSIPAQAIVHGTDVPDILSTPIVQPKSFPIKSIVPRANPTRFTVEVLLTTMENKQIIFNGTQISPDLILISAHNIAPEVEAKSIKSLVVSFFENSQTKSLSIPVTKYIIHPGYAAFANVNALALLKLSVSMMDDYRKFPLLPTAVFGINRNQEVYIAGSGIQNLMTNASYGLKEGVMTYGNLPYMNNGNPVIIDEYVSGGQRPALGILRPIDDGQNATQLACYGDSGGPAYVNLPSPAIPGDRKTRISINQEPRAVLWGLIEKGIFNFTPSETPRVTGLMDIAASNPKSFNAKTISCEHNTGVTVVSHFTDWILATAHSLGAIAPEIFEGTHIPQK